MSEGTAISKQLRSLLTCSDKLPIVTLDAARDARPPYSEQLILDQAEVFRAMLRDSMVKSLPDETLESCARSEQRAACALKLADDLKVAVRDASDAVRSVRRERGAGKGAGAEE